MENKLYWSFAAVPCVSLFLCTVTLPANAADVVGAPAVARAPVEATGQFVVTHFKISGNAMLTDNVLQATVARYVGTPMTIKGLDAVKIAVEKAYADKGYVGVVAYFPEQHIIGGEVELHVLEGRLSKIRIHGNQHFSDADVRRSLPSLRVGESINSHLVNANVDVADENPARNVYVTFKPGEQQGTVDADVTVQDHSPWVGNVSLDNTGTEGTGFWRLGGSLSYANLFNRDQVASLQYQVSPLEPQKVYFFYGSYTAPLYEPGLIVGIFASAARTALTGVATPAGPLDFNGDVNAVGGFVTKILPSFSGYSHRITLNLAYRDYLNECSVSNVAGTCGGVGVGVITMPLTASYIGTYSPVSGKFAFAGSLGLDQNFSTGGKGGSTQFDEVRTGAHPGYNVVHLQFSTRIGAEANFNAQASVQAQLASGPLVSGVLYHLGGAYTVRGYNEGEVAADNGILARFELYGKKTALWGGQIRPLAFFDYGRAWDSDDSICDASHLKSMCTLAGTGVGVRWQDSKVQLRVDVARTLVNGPDTQAGSWFTHVGLVYLF